MEKERIEQFISKYNLGGACEKVTIKSDGTDLTVKAITDDQRLIISGIKGIGIKLPSGDFSIFDTKKFKSLLSVLDDNIKVSTNKTGNNLTGLVMSDNNTKVTVVLGDDTVIPTVPPIKKMPPMDVTFDIDAKFINSFVKGRGALGTDIETFTVMSDGKGTEASIVLGYAKQNTNRVNITVNTTKNTKMDPISFSADLLREVLLANREIEKGTFEVSSQGISRVKFSNDKFEVEYYLIEIETDD